MTPAVARVAWTAPGGDPRTENLCKRHAHALMHLLTLVNIRGLAGDPPDDAPCQRCRKDHP